MDAKATLQRTAAFGGPAALAVGTSLMTLALVGTGHGRYPAQAGEQPGPTATATATVTATLAPTASGSTVLPPPEVVAAAGPPHVSSQSAARPGRGTPSGPSPTSRSPATAWQCGGDVLTVRTLRSACAAIGGSR